MGSVQHHRKLRKDAWREFHVELRPEPFRLFRHGPNSYTFLHDHEHHIVWVHKDTTRLFWQAEIATVADYDLKGMDSFNLWMSPFRTRQDAIDYARLNLAGTQAVKKRTVQS